MPGALRAARAGCEALTRAPRRTQLVFFLLFGPRLPPLSEGAGGAVRPRGSGKHAPATASARRLRPHVAGREADADVPYHVRAHRAAGRPRGACGVGASATAPTPRPRR